MDALPSKLLKNDAALDAGPSARGTRVERCFATAIDRWCFGGAGRDRTDDLLLAKQALSQLSYGPGLTQCWHTRMPQGHPMRAANKRGGPG